MFDIVDSFHTMSYVNLDGLIYIVILILIFCSMYKHLWNAVCISMKSLWAKNYR